MLANPQPPRIHLPKGWQEGVKSAVLHAMALAHYAIVYPRAWAADSIHARVRLAAENNWLHEACALLREEIRIKDTRMVQIAPRRRPHYGPHERMAILELRSARGWTLKQTADTFLVTPATIASWVKRIDEHGSDALLQLREPVNKFPDFVRYIVQRLKTLSPSMGKVKIAETLCREGLHLGVTTVGRNLKEAPQPGPWRSGILHWRRDRQTPQPCLACRPHSCSNIGGLLGTLVTVRITPVLAVLLVGGGGHRSSLSTYHGYGHIQELTNITISTALSRARHG